MMTDWNNEINFVNSGRYGIFLLIPLSLLLIFIFEKIRSKRMLLLRNEIQTSNQKSYLRYFPVLLILLLVFSYLRPYIGSETINLPGQSKDILILQDISKSMLAEDTKPSRLEFSKRKLEDIVRFLSSDKHPSRIGLILFSGESYLYCPLTEDFSVISHFIKSISTDLITSQGTAISEAYDTAVKSLKEVQSKSPSVLLISDGEDNYFNISDIAGKSTDNNIPINVIGVGSEEGAPIPDAQNGFLKDNSGNIVISKLKDSTLKLLAQETNGRYLRATPDNSDIKQIFDNTTWNSEEHKGIKSFTIYKEYGHILTLAALLILLSQLLLTGKILFLHY